MGGAPRGYRDVYTRGSLYAGGAVMIMEQMLGIVLQNQVVLLDAAYEQVQRSDLRATIRANRQATMQWLVTHNERIHWK